MGAAPGPACYGLGGRSATITDAFLVCGFVSPTAFLGGRRTLDAERARAALAKHIGGPLELDADAAAKAVIEVAWDAVTVLARDTAAEAGWDPAECTIYAYGGNGPLFVTAVADRLGARGARFFRFGSVYSAYGSAISDVVHVYESGVAGADHLGRIGADLISQAHRDLRGEGFDAAAASLEWELRSASSSTRGEGTEPAALAKSLDGAPTLLRLTARYPLPRLEQPTLDGSAAVPATGSRLSPYGVGGSLPTYDAAVLADAKLSGPLLADGGTYTWLITDGWDLTTDARGDAFLTRK